LDDTQADYLGAPNGHSLRNQEAAQMFGTPEEEISHLKLTITHLSRELEVERIRHRRTTDGARLLDDCVWDLQRRLEKARRPFFLRWLAAAFDLTEAARETAWRLLRRARRAVRSLLAAARETMRSLEPAAQSTILLLMPIAKQQRAYCGRTYRRLLALKRPIRDRLRSFDWLRPQRP
jgi:hypothetical protein